MQRARPVLWDIYEEHLDEAAFLWAQWERALSASSYTLSEVATGPEERLLAHLDGLVLGGSAVTERLLLPALCDGDPGRVSAAGWALLHAEDADHFEALWGALVGAVGEAPRRRALSRALELSHRADLPERLRSRLRAVAPEIQACVIDALSARDAAEVSQLSLQSLATGEHPELLGAVLRAVQRVPDPAYLAWVGQGLASEHLETRVAAIEAGVLLRVPSTRGICRRLVAERAPDRRLAMGVLAIGHEARDHARLIEWSKAADLAASAIWALGFTGSVDVAELLLGLLDDAALAPVAAESFSSITGLLLEGSLVQPGESASLDEPFDDDGPVPELVEEDDLPIPAPEPIRAWWRGQRSAFDPAQRYVMGERWSPDAVRGALTRSPTWRHQVWRLALGQDVARLDSRRWARERASGASSGASSL